MSSRVSGETVAGFSLENFDKGGQVGLAGVERIRRDWKFLMKHYTDECCDPGTFI